MTDSFRDGYLLNNRYRIIEKCGEGGMSNVYLAFDMQENKKRAIKQLKKDKKRKSIIGYFRQEAELLKNLNHPNLPKVFDYNGENETHYMVMEYIDGFTPEEYIEDTNQALSAELVISIAKQMCDALNFLHTRNPPIIFRDMKPENIMIVRGDDQIKLIDLGIVRFHKSNKRRDTHFAGTRPFMAPEVLEKKLSDQRSDIYSLGATLYYLLTLDEPPDDLSGKKEFDPLEKLAAQSNTLPKLNEVIITATRPNPRDRYQSIHEMRTALSATTIHQSNLTEVSIEEQPSFIRTRVRRTTEFLVEHFSTTQLAVLSFILIAVIGVLTLQFGFWIRNNFPLLWQLFPFFYAIGPFVYAISNRKGVAGITHFFLQMVTGSVTLATLGLDGRFIVAMVSSITMEFGLGISSTRKTKLWRCVIATALSVAASWAVLEYIGGESIHPVQIVGGGFAGFIAYSVGEIVLEGIQGIQDAEINKKNK